MTPSISSSTCLVLEVLGAGCMYRDQGDTDTGEGAAGLGSSSGVMGVEGGDCGRSSRTRGDPGRDDDFMRRMDDTDTALAIFFFALVTVDRSGDATGVPVAGAGDA